MSDVRARAEARRKKILERGHDRLAVAKGEMVVNVDDRPLATRNTLIRTSSVLQADVDKSLDDINEGNNPLHCALKSEEVNSLCPDEPKSIPAYSEGSMDCYNSGPSSTAPEISIVSKKNDPGNDSELPDISTQKPGATTRLKVPINSIMRVIRLFIIVLLGFLGGYNFSRSRNLAAFTNEFSTPLPSKAIPYFNEEFDSSETFSGSGQLTGYPTYSRTWSQWAWDWQLALLTNPLTAVPLAYILSSYLRPLVDKLIYGRPRSTGGGWLVLLFSIARLGYAGVVTAMYDILGDLSVHILALLLSIVFCSELSLSDEGQSVSKTIFEEL